MSATAEKQETVKFRAKGAMFKAIRKGANRYQSPNGDQVVTEGVEYDFAPNGEYETSDPDAIEHLRSLGSFNREFWEVGAEPHSTPAPDVVFEAIMEAMGELDDDALALIEVEETTTHKREAVLKAVAAARRKVQGMTEATAPEGGGQGSQE